MSKGFCRHEVILLSLALSTILLISSWVLVLKKETLSTLMKGLLVRYCCSRLSNSSLRVPAWSWLRFVLMTQETDSLHIHSTKMASHFILKRIRGGDLGSLVGQNSFSGCCLHCLQKVSFVII